MSLPPFSTVFQALNYFLHANPARQKETCIIELDRGSKPIYEQFSGKYPADIWASVCKGIQRILSEWSEPHRLAFELYYLHKAKEHIGKKKIANKLNISQRSFRRMIEDLEDEFAKRQLIPPIDNRFR
jgi:hypothetical protein